jgi:YHS domain-containing protein
MTSCPVCGAEIGEANPKPDEGYGSEVYPEAQTEYRGETYQFCCSEHRETFESDPEEYA